MGEGIIMKNKIIEFALKLLGNKLDGKKTAIGGVTSILTGIGAIITGLLGIVRKIFPDMTDLPDLSIDECWTSLVVGGSAIGFGFSMLGLGGKQEKAKRAVQEQTVVIQEQNKLITEQNELIKKNPSGMSPENGL